MRAVLGSKRCIGRELKFASVLSALPVKCAREHSQKIGAENQHRAANGKAQSETQQEFGRTQPVANVPIDVLFCLSVHLALRSLLFCSTIAHRVWLLQKPEGFVHKMQCILLPTNDDRFRIEE